MYATTRLCLPVEARVKIFFGAGEHDKKAKGDKGWSFCCIGCFTSGVWIQSTPEEQE